MAVPIVAGRIGGVMVDEQLVMLTGPRAVATGARERRDRAASGQLSRATTAQVAPVLLVAVGMAAVLGLAFVHPVADRVPNLSIAVETAITWLALTAAVMVRARLVHTACARDLLEVMALLLLSVLLLCCNVVPFSFELHPAGALGATRILGDLIVAGTFAVAASTLPDRLVTHRRRAWPTAVGGVLAMGFAVVLGGLVLRGVLVTTSDHPVSGFGNALHRPITCVLVGATTGLLIYAAIDSTAPVGWPVSPGAR